MKPHRIAATCTFALMASVASAQSADMPAESPATRQDCVKRHDHGAERQMPMPQTGCKAAEKVGKAQPKAKKTDPIQGHDHGKVHKNQ
ncbi:hypothetical protein GCM10028796_05130 [Ramlibacter monticola]|uniref:TrbC/VirB2 family protein n=1 Tax=Ramlibacter monticola TaxID=1926872 RepID=A0A936YXJ6_9BURK|nr:TrbC/VirB2 family protein [Ramlibacter monticola]MBL0391209.1 TrbC/VirB2 family protein [Ramlibacter monticola]